MGCNHITFAQIIFDEEFVNFNVFGFIMVELLSQYTYERMSTFIVMSEYDFRTKSFTHLEQGFKI